MIRLPATVIASWHLLAVSFFGSLPVMAGQAKTIAIVGQAAPEFSLTDELGTNHQLRDYRGKIVVLEWTNPQCPFVVRHYDQKTMTTLAKSLEESVVWLAINSSHFNEPKNSKEWREQRQLSFPTLQDPTGAVARSYGAKTTPHMYVIDAQGILQYAGAIDDDTYGKKKDPQNYVQRAVNALKSGTLPAQQSTTPYGCSVKYKN